MREVSKEEFFARVNPLDVHPYDISDCYPYSFDWKERNKRQLVGRTIGYIEGGALKHRYYLA